MAKQQRKFLRGREGPAIWYLLHCPHQREQEFARVCKQCLKKEILKDAFVLTYDRMRRYEGAWHLERRLLFPGYVFLEGENLQNLAEELKNHPDICKAFLIGGRLIPVEEAEKHFLKNLCETGHHSGMSRGYIRRGQTVVTEGPLKGKEHLIRKIDRHKRIAQVELPIEKDRLEREPCRIQIGLEIVEKSPL